MYLRESDLEAVVHQARAVPLRHEAARHHPPLVVDGAALRSPPPTSVCGVRRFLEENAFMGTRPRPAHHQQQQETHPRTSGVCCVGRKATANSSGSFDDW